MIFIVGNSRSGTTMMGRIFGKHPNVYTFGELHFFGQLCAPPFSLKIEKKEIEKIAAQLFCVQREGYRTYGNPRRFLSEAQAFLAGLTVYPDTPAALFEAFLRCGAAENGRTTPCDQTPRNVFYIADILKLYPKARIINMIRDPRDVLLSQKRRWKRKFLGGSDMPIKETLRDWMNYHPITISHIWRTAINAADQFAGRERVVSVYFEELLTHPQQTVESLCNFVGITYIPEMLQVPQVGSSVGEDRPQQLGINPQRAHSWHSDTTGGELSSAEIYLNQRITAPLMKKHNYSPASIQPNVVSLMLHLLTFPMKLGGAFLFNLDRMKNIRETLKRRL
ncbi:sulfotransferase [Candidatus Poribacteria bacterium]|nr:sulfotransferase [Candidatus Poribacteria bacterium]MYG06753.1 sulfotransferase [Candidatus Poribacteria bacterium]MYK24431.1 sulfotransferase [Candidatus Poribacteria bacterium]